jgi:hypothetical protein
LALYYPSKENDACNVVLKKKRKKKKKKEKKKKKKERKEKKHKWFLLKMGNLRDCINKCVCYVSMEYV